MITIVEPLIAVALAFIFFDELLGAWQWIVFAMVSLPRLFWRAQRPGARSCGLPARRAAREPTDEPQFTAAASTFDGSPLAIVTRGALVKQLAMAVKRSDAAMRLENKTVPIAAAGQGMGRAAALACAAEGAQVFASDIAGEAPESLKREDPSIRTRRLDVTKPEEIAAAAAELPDLDGLFNCAGFVHQGTILEVSDAEWAFSLNLNVTSMLRMIRALLPGMLRRAERGGASIVNMAFMASSVKGFPRRTAYVTTKAP